MCVCVPCFAVSHFEVYLQLLFEAIWERDWNKNEGWVLRGLSKKKKTALVRIEGKAFFFFLRRYVTFARRMQGISWRFIGVFGATHSNPSFLPSWLGSFDLLLPVSEIYVCVHKCVLPIGCGFLSIMLFETLVDGHR